MIELNVKQGSPEWKAGRKKTRNASDYPSAQGLSKKFSRSALVAEIATGIEREFSPFMEKILENGHLVEVAARPIAEKIIGEELFPLSATSDDGYLGASSDGLTMLMDTGWECKQWNAELADSVSKGVVPDTHSGQLDQQGLVFGVGRILFMVTDGTPEKCVHCWYTPSAEAMAKIIPTWKQLDEDVANYQHEEVIAAPVAATIEALPTLFVQVEGKVLATNLDAFKLAAQSFIDGIKTELVNDQDFADADKMVKFLKDGEDRLALCKDQAQSQANSIDELFRTIDAISEQMRVKRLALDKLVKAEKENRRAEIVRNASLTLNQHVAKLNERIGGNWMPVWSMQIFNDAIKGLKSLDSMRDKVSTAIANEKIAANEIADTIEANIKAIPEQWKFLFADMAQICTKPGEDFARLAESRIAAHEAAEAAKAEAAKKAEDARIAAAVEAERKAGEARAAAAIEAERMAEAKRVADGARNALKEAIISDVLQANQPTPETKRAAVVDAQDDISAFMNTRDFGKEPSRIRAILVEFVKFQAERGMRKAA